MPNPSTQHVTRGALPTQGEPLPPTKSWCLLVLQAAGSPGSARRTSGSHSPQLCHSDRSTGSPGHDLKEQAGEKRVMVVLHFAGSISLPSQLSLALEALGHSATSQSLFPDTLCLTSRLSSSLPTQPAMSMDAPIQG